MKKLLQAPPAGFEPVDASDFEVMTLGTAIELNALLSRAFRSVVLEFQQISSEFIDPVGNIISVLG
ncbi:hypothetical protein [Calycomorphotria hydatis]|uniref:Uncharacterized protein n=1 Tax=Calycomorphotria hydatis TaxID=2528027 RepID=A0A517TDC3_9PLAN|nr:hypothetical protein [Calycomorphotria hydatis]QDT66378.1 hypothetical protein V22_36450 [Calycomorphotria hydatis]